MTDVNVDQELVEEILDEANISGLNGVAARACCEGLDAIAEAQKAGKVDAEIRATRKAAARQIIEQAVVTAWCLCEQKPDEFLALLSGLGEWWQSHYYSPERYAIQLKARLSGAIIAASTATLGQPANVFASRLDELSEQARRDGMSESDIEAAGTEAMEQIETRGARFKAEASEMRDFMRSRNGGGNPSPAA